MTHKSCDEMEEMLVEYADGELSPSELSQVAAHLAECERCRRTLQALAKSLGLADVVWEGNLAELAPVCVPLSRKPRRLRWAKHAAIAASILLVLGTSLMWHAHKGPATQPPNLAEIERKVAQAGNAARLLAATDLLAKYPATEALAERQYRYIIERYPDTPAAAKVQLRMK